MARLSQVVPTILTDDPETLKALVRQAETFTNYVQFDIMDGQFVPSQSITWKHVANLPMKLSWEVHLMVMGPEEYVESFCQVGAQKIIFHYEATPSPQEVISRIRSCGLKVGLALNPETPVSEILALANKVDSVLFLSVHPGFYGAQFIPEVLDKVAEFRRARPNVEIGLDGGVKENNIAQIAQAGVDTIYVGSAISLQPRPADSYHRLVTLARQGPRQRR